MCTHCGQPPLSISCTKGPTCVQPHGPTEDPIKQVQVHYTVALVYARYMRGVVWYTHGIRTVYAGIRWYTLVVVWYTHGIRVVYGWYLWYPHGIRMVYAWYTHGIRVVYAWTCVVCARYTLVYAGIRQWLWSDISSSKQAFSRGYFVYRRHALSSPCHSLERYKYLVYMLLLWVLYKKIK